MIAISGGSLLSEVATARRDIDRQQRTDARVRAYHMQRAAAKREKKALRSAMVERRTTLARAARSSVMRDKPRGNRHE